LLEAAPELGGKLVFATNEILLRFPDRLRAPNDDATFAEVSRDVTPLLDKLYGVGAFSVARGAAAPEPLSLRVKANASPALSVLLAALGG
jgi:hypothetical protein